MTLRVPSIHPERHRRACERVLGIPYDPQVRGRGCPPPPAGRVLRYCRIDDVGLYVDRASWARLRGRVARVDGEDVRIPDIEPTEVGDVEAITR